MMNSMISTKIRNDSLALVDTYVVEFDPTLYGSASKEKLKIHIHKVKGKKDINRKALIFLHGGGAVMQSPEEYYWMSSRLALEGDMTVFSVQYRLGPEFKIPTGIYDAYAALKYIIKEADRFNIDPKTIGLQGISGGGFMATGVTYLLAQNNECGLIKTVFLDMP